MIKNQIIIPISMLLLSLSIVSCKQKQNEKVKDGIQVDNMDLNMNPGTDFYEFANGGWMKSTEIPDDESRWGSFNELREKNDSMTLALVDKALNNKSIKANSDEGKVVSFFKVAMNTEELNKQGIEPIQDLLAKIDAIETVEDIVDYTIEMEPYLGGLFGSGVYSDLKNSTINALYLGTGSLGLPERDYYLQVDEDSKDKRAKYVTHITTMLQFLGDDKSSATEQAKRILEFETKMASNMLSKEDKRNPLNLYNPKTIEELDQLSPRVNWAKYFEGIGAKNFEQVIVSEPKYISSVSYLLTNQPISTIKEYFRWTLLNNAASYLSEDIDQANFDFYGKALKDLKAQKPRNERVLQTTNRVLGEALGKLYVDEYFPSEAKRTAVEMVNNIRKAYEKRIDNLDWMTDSTKVMAKKKLNGMTVKIGYPDKWKDYSDLDIVDEKNGGSYFKNILNARQWNYAEDIAKIGKPVDKTEWFMSPQTVNAYYNPTYNEIVFPAAILQAPFFDFQADAAVNYGGMGAVIGHEISHGFDDQGARFDAEGNMNDWWTKTDFKNFQERGKQLVAQYDSYEPLPGIFVNGTFTLGENIGDLGGVNAAYDGLKIHQEQNGADELIDDMTPEQRFFVNWATVWRTKIRDEALKNQIKTDPHSPGVYRAVGPLVNVDGFYEAFDIGEDDAMFKPADERVRIW